MKVRSLSRLGIAVGAATALVLSGCSGGGNSGNDANGNDKVNLEFVTWQDTEAGISDWWNEVIAAWEDDHPGDTITIRHVESTDISKFVTNRFAAGDPPAILHLPTAVFPVFAAKELLEPLDARLAKTDILEKWPKAQSLLKWDGKTEGLMIFGYPVDLFYNESLLKAAGQSVPTTPEELIDVAKATTKGDVFGYGSVTKQDRDLMRQVSSFVVGYGGSWIKDGKYQFSDPAVLDALAAYKDASKYSPKGIASAQKRELFIQGKVAMMLDGPFLIPEFKKAPPDVKKHIKVARAPFKNVSYYPANGLSIPASLSDKKKDLAWDFLKLSASKKFQKRFVELYQSPAPRAGAGQGVKTSPLLTQFLKDAPDSVGILPTSPEVRSNWGVFDKAVQDGIMQMLTSDKEISSIFAGVQSELQSRGVKP